MAGDKDSKTLPPTPRRKKEARKKGQVAKSSDLAGWVSLLVAMTLAGTVVRSITGFATEAMTVASQVGSKPDAALAPKALGAGLWAAVTSTLPLFVALMLAGIITNFAQVGPLWSSKALKPDPKRLNPIAGVKRLVSKKGLWELVKAIGKAAVVALAALGPAERIFHQLLTAGAVPVGQGMTAVANGAADLVRQTAMAGLVIAAVDFGLQKWWLRRDLMMTMQEYKEEAKMSEGDPHVKQRQKQIAAEMAQATMLADAAEADVVVVNPTAIAIAIRYRSGTDAAPVVVAKGAGELAAKIRGIAADNAIPVLEAKPLARALWRICEPGEAVPVALYEAVALVLAFCHRLRATPMAPRNTVLPARFAADVDDTEIAKLKRRPRALPA